MIDFFNIASRISQVKYTDADLTYIKTGLQDIVNHDKEFEFFNYCKKWKLAPWVFIQLQKNSFINVLINVKDSFKKEYLKVKQQNDNRNKIAKEFLQAFIDEGIEVIILKGNYFAHSVYGDIGYKRMNDFDILVKKENWDKIQDIYLKLGFIPLGFGWSGEKEQPADFSHVGMAFISPDFNCIIGTQWGLKSPTTKFNIDIQKAWETSKPFNFYGIEVKVLSYEYNMLHLILHLGVFKCGIRDCMDLYNLELSDKNVNHKKLIDFIIQSNAQNKAFFAFTICNLCGPFFNDELVNKFKSNSTGFLQKRLNKRLNIFKITKDFQYSYNDYFQDIEKVVIYFNLFPKFHKKIKYYALILKMIYFPSKKMVIKLNDLPPNYTKLSLFMARLNSPYIVFSLIAQEIGWKFTVLLFIKLFFDLLISIKNYFYKKESYFDYLQKRGINPINIEKAVKNIQ